MVYTVPTYSMFDMFRKKNKEKNKVALENKELKKEVQRLHEIEDVYMNAITECENIKKQFESAMKEAKEAQDNYRELINELLKFQKS